MKGIDSMFELNMTANATVSKTVSTDVMLLLQIAEQFMDNPSANGNITDCMTGEVLFIVEEGKAVYFAGAVDEVLTEMLMATNPFAGLALMLGEAMVEADVRSVPVLPSPDEIIAGIVS